MFQTSDNGKTLISKIPILLGRFEIIKSLGEGAVGAVYLARDREHAGKPVALKVLANQIEYDEHTRERFKQEILLLKEIDHPNVIKAYDLIETSDCLAYTMEYVEGHDLGSIYRSKNFSIEEVDRIFEQLLLALAAMHNRGIWHRDIKLENIMIAEDGTVKLMDLGLVKNVFQKNLTKTGVLLGTAQYMPPEYVKSAAYDGRSDLYAVGVVLYEVVARERRMADLPGQEVIEHLIKLNFQIEEKRLSKLPKRYARLIKKAMESNPKNRFQTAEDMIAAIKVPEAPLVEHRPVELSTHIEMDTLYRSQKKKHGTLWGKIKKIFPFTIILMTVSTGITVTALTIVLK